MYKIGYALVISLLLLSMACRKEVEKLVIQDRQYSWMARPGFKDSFGILLGSGKGPTGLYFQQPAGFAALESQPNGSLNYSQYVSWGSGNLDTRFLIGPEFLAAYYDTVVYLVPNTQPVTSHAGGLIRLKSLDSRAQFIQPSAYLATPFAALSQHNYLLFPYESGRYDFKNRLVLSHIVTTSNFNFPVYGAQSKILELPLAPTAYNNYQPRLIQSFDDYFLVDCGTEGVYKVTEAGSFRQVMPSNTYAYAFFKWQGALWATLADSKLAISTDNGFGGCYAPLRWWPAVHTQLEPSQRHLAAAPTQGRRVKLHRY